MGLGMIFAGLCFLLTPCFNVIDLLPDFIGCMLIRSGLSKIAFLSDRLREAQADVRRLMAVSFSKIAGLALVWMFRDETTTLLITFTFSVLELIFTLPLIRNLTEGAEDLGIRYDGTAATQSADTVRILLTVFLWARCAGAVIPEIFCLWNPEYTGELSANYHQVEAALRQAKILTTILQYVGVGVFAGVVGVHVRRLFSGMRRDAGFVARMEEDWRERFGNNEKLQHDLRVDKTLFLLIVATLLSFRLYMGNINYLPDFLFFILLWFALKSFPKNPEEKGFMKIAILVMGALSVFCFGLRTYGAAVFYPVFPQRWQEFFPVYYTGVISAATLGIGLFFAIRLLDDCSERIYGRRRIKTLFMKVLAVIVALCALGDYAFPSIYYFLNTLDPATPLTLKRTADWINTGISVVGGAASVWLILRMWVVGSALRADLLLNQMKKQEF